MQPHLGVTFPGQPGGIVKAAGSSIPLKCSVPCLRSRSLENDASQRELPGCRAWLLTGSVAIGALSGMHGSKMTRSAQTRQRRTLRLARRVPLTVETSEEQVLSTCTASRFNEWMVTDREDIIFGAVDSEPVPEDNALSYVYFPPLDVGPFRAKVRMTCALGEPTPSKAEVVITEINPGVVDVATGHVEYQTDPTELLEATSTVIVRWRQVENGLRVSQQVTQRLIFKIPDWFPVPDPLFVATLRPFVQNTIRESMKGLFARLNRLSK